MLQACTGVDVALAAERIRPYARRTPLLHTRIDGRPVVLKLEYLQLSGSFQLPARSTGTHERAATSSAVVAASAAANHGTGLASAAALVSRPVTVFVPTTAPEAKARRIEQLGARLARHG